MNIFISQCNVVNIVLERVKMCCKPRANENAKDQMFSKIVTFLLKVSHLFHEVLRILASISVGLDLWGLNSKTLVRLFVII